MFDGHTERKIQSDRIDANMRAPAPRRARGRAACSHFAVDELKRLTDDASLFVFRVVS